MAKWSILLLTALCLAEIAEGGNKEDEAKAAAAEEAAKRRVALGADIKELFLAFAKCLSRSSYEYSGLPYGNYLVTRETDKMQEKANKGFDALQALYTAAPEVKKPPGPVVDAKLKELFEACMVKAVPGMDKSKIEGLLRLKHSSSSYETISETYKNAGEFKATFARNWKVLAENDKYLQTLVPKLEEAFPPGTDGCWGRFDSYSVSKVFCAEDNMLDFETVRELFQCLANSHPNMREANKPVDPKDVKKITTMVKILKWGMDKVYCDRFRKKQLTESGVPYQLVEWGVISKDKGLGNVAKGILTMYCLTFALGFDVGASVTLPLGLVLGLVVMFVGGSFGAFIDFFLWLLATLFCVIPREFMTIVRKLPNLFEDKP